MPDTTHSSFPGPQTDDKLDALLSRINAIATRDEAADADEELSKPRPLPHDEAPFTPRAPQTLEETGISEAMMEELICKFLLAHGNASVREITKQVALPIHMVEHVVAHLKMEQVVAYVGTGTMNDHVCRLTDLGMERAKRFNQLCSYYGAAPVSFDDYVKSVEIQTITDQSPSEEDLQRAFHDLLIDPTMMVRLGPAVNSGKGMFLYGYPGNGKTSIAERITAAFGKYVWIPRCITVDRDLIQLYDPMSHVEAPLRSGDGIINDDQIDQRWIRIERPTIVVGGELQMAHLEIQYNPVTGISEAPVQMKSNTGLLLIDDFGRQRMSVDELLNRWIVPLEKRFDFLNTSNGKKIQVPFDQLVVFSTNLEPKDLVDDAFLRRIPYKIEITDPTLENFVKLFEIMCERLQFEYRPAVIKRMIERHYLPIGRPFRNCHPRDLLLQVQNYCQYLKRPMELSDEAFDFAAENYFSIM